MAAEIRTGEPHPEPGTIRLAHTISPPALYWYHTAIAWPLASIAICGSMMRSPSTFSAKVAPCQPGAGAADAVKAACGRATARRSAAANGAARPVLRRFRFSIPVLFDAVIRCTDELAPQNCPYGTTGSIEGYGAWGGSSVAAERLGRASCKRNGASKPP